MGTLMGTRSAGNSPVSPNESSSWRLDSCGPTRWTRLTWFVLLPVAGPHVAVEGRAARDRGEPRLFRISRVQGEVRFTGDPGSYEVPADAKLRDVAAALFPPTPDRTALLRVAAGRAHGLRTAAVSTTALDDGRDEIEVPFAMVSDLAAEVASYGDGVVVVGPADVRDAVVEHLRGVGAPPAAKIAEGGGGL